MPAVSKNVGALYYGPGTASWPDRQARTWVEECGEKVWLSWAVCLGRGQANRDGGGPCVICVSWRELAVLALVLAQTCRVTPRREGTTL